MKLPNQDLTPARRSPRHQDTPVLVARDGVAPSFIPIPGVGSLCKLACKALSGTARTICEMGCDLF
jgi:hypothetical protein